MPTMDWVIDADTHITEPGDLWTSRLASKFQDRAPRIVRNPETGVDLWQIGDGMGFMPVGHTATAGWPEPFPAAPRELRRSSRSPHFDPHGAPRVHGFPGHLGDGALPERGRLRQSGASWASRIPS